jgi:hypothetical protein
MAITETRKSVFYSWYVCAISGYKLVYKELITFGGINWSSPVRSKSYAYNLSIAAIAGSNTAEGMVVRPFRL